MRAEPGGEPVRRLGKLLALAGLPALIGSLALAGHAYLDRRAGLVAELEARARDHHRAIAALLEGPAGAEAPVGPPRDVAGGRERARALVEELDWPVGTVRLVAVDAAAGSPPPAAEPEPDRLFREPLPGGGLLLEHRVEAGTLRRVAAAAALPWLLAGAACAASLVLAHALLRRGILTPAVAALDALVAAAGGRPAAAGAEPGWAAPWLEAGRLAAGRQSERLAAAEAAEAPLAAALEAIEEGVALLAADGRLLHANAAFARVLGGRGAAPPALGRPLEPQVQAALARKPGVRTLELASGDRLILLATPGESPPGAAAAAPRAPSLPVPPGGPRLACIVQEVAEALASVTRQAVLLHELTTDPATRERAEQLRRAAERCTRAIAPLLAPERPARPTAIALDRLLEARVERLRQQGVEVVAGIAPGLPAIAADPDRLADLLDGLFAAARPSAEGGVPARLRVRLRRGGPGLLLEVERAGGGAAEAPAGLALLAHRARELGAEFAAEVGRDGAPLLRLALPLASYEPREPTLDRLLVLEGERGAA